MIISIAEKKRTGNEREQYSHILRKITIDFAQILCYWYNKAKIIGEVDKFVEE